MVKYKIRIDDNISLEELRLQIANGARFIVYQYCISIFFAVSLRRLSPAILTGKNESGKHRKKYNLLTLIFGWWAIPYGIIHSINSITINNKGGIDVTEDIMLNIDNDSFENREVVLKINNQLFCKPDKENLRAFKDTLLKDFEKDFKVKKIIVGIFINTDEHTKPFFTIGITVEKDYEKYVEKAKTSLYKEFRKHVYFDFIDLTKTDIGEQFEKQGEVLINRTSPLLS